MKWLAVVLCSMVAGAVGGSLVASGRISLVERAHSVPIASADRIQTKDLTLVDDANKPAARLRVAGAQARFEFLSTSGQTILEIETNREAHSGRIDFLDGGRNVLGLVMRGAQENHEGAIYLGDSERQGRIALGAIGTDIGGAPTEEWGLAVTSPHSGKINVLVQSDRTQRPRVIFGAIEADGTGRAVSSK